MKILMSHPTGNANVRAAALGFYQADILANFYTSIATFKGTFQDRLSTFDLLSELNRRRFDDRLCLVTKTWPWIELFRILSSKAGLRSMVKHEKGIFSVDAVYRSLDKKIATLLTKKDGLSSVYAYEDGALETFRRAKQCGIETIYDLPIGYWKAAREFLKQEEDRWPEWMPTITSFRDSNEKLSRKDEELKLADRIFVASSFTAKTLDFYPGKLAPIHVIPYGFPAVVRERHYSKLDNRPLKLLFVGGLSQRKGIADLFAAVKNIGKSVELTIVGQKNNALCRPLDLALNAHTWIPSLPHAEILKLMQVHDVLVFPSLFEGFGLVITEAMSQGLPVITTDRTAGPDLINNGQNGWIIEAGSTVALQKAIEAVLNNPDTIVSAGRSAMAEAKLRSWENYGLELAKAIMKDI